jgi:hypothetical protein
MASLPQTRLKKQIPVVLSPLRLVIASKLLKFAP